MMRAGGAGILLYTIRLAPQATRDRLSMIVSTVHQLKPMLPGPSVQEHELMERCAQHYVITFVRFPWTAFLSPLASTPLKETQGTISAVGKVTFTQLQQQRRSANNQINIISQNKI